MAKKHRKRVQKAKQYQTKANKTEKVEPQEITLAATQEPVEKQRLQPTHNFINNVDVPEVPTTPEEAVRLESEFGRVGLNQLGGFLFEEDLPALRDTSQRLKFYKEIGTNDAVTGAILFAIDMLMRQVEWRFEPASDEPNAQDGADFMESVINDMSQSWQDTLSEIMSFLTYGWSYHELVYKKRSGDNERPGLASKFDDGKVGWRKLPIRGQDTLFNWKFDDEGGLLAMVQIPPPDFGTRTVPIGKSLLFRTSVYKTNPEGESIFRHAFRDWRMKKNIENYEAIGIERDLAGFPVLYVPSDWTDPGSPQAASYTQAKKIATNIKRDEQEGVVFPSIYDDKGNRLLELQLLTSGGKRNFDVDAVIKRYDKRIAMTVLADFLFLGQDKVGSFALSSDKTRLFSTALGTWLDMIASVFNRHAIPRLWRLNGFPMETMPQLEHDDLEKDDPEAIGAFIEALGKVGITIDDLDTVNHLRRVGGLPEVDELELNDRDEFTETLKQMRSDLKKATN